MTDPPRGLTYRWKLLFFLSVATIFEGYDFVALSQVLPQLRLEMGLDRFEGGLLYAVINVGTIAAWFLVRKADVWGRKRVLSITIAGYTVFTFLTGLTTDPYTFAAAQLIARTFLIGEWALSMVYAAEEFPAHRRGVIIGALQAMSAIGGVVCAGVTPLLLSTPFGWRSVYFVGILPLILLAFARRGLKESSRFAEIKSRPPSDFFAITRTPYFKRVLQLGLIWTLVYGCTNSVIAFWKDFAVNERGLDDTQCALAISIAALVSMPLIFLAGFLLDKIGRRRGSVVIFLVSTVGVAASYTLYGQWPLTVALIFGIFAVSAPMPILNAYGTELFPTHFRADAFAWANNLLGRFAYILSPVLIGLVANVTGYGPAVAATSVLLLVAMVLVLRMFPETAGRELEETSQA